MLVTAVGLYGVKAWSIVACALRGRTGKQCRERHRYQLLQIDPKFRAMQPVSDRKGAANQLKPTHQTGAHHKRTATLKTLQIDADVCSLPVVTEPVYDDEPGTPRKRARYIGEPPEGLIGPGRPVSRPPWSAPPVSYPGYGLPRLDSDELATLGLPAVSTDEFGSTDVFEPAACGHGQPPPNITPSTAGKVHHGAPTLPSSSVDWDALLAVGTAISSPSISSSPLSREEGHAEAGVSHRHDWSWQAEKSAVASRGKKRGENPADEAFLLPRPAVELQLAQPAGYEADSGNCILSGCGGLMSPTADRPTSVSADDQLAECLQQFGERLVLSPLATSPAEHGRGRASCSWWNARGR